MERQLKITEALEAISAARTAGSRGEAHLYLMRHRPDDAELLTRAAKEAATMRGAVVSLQEALEELERMNGGAS